MQADYRDILRAYMRLVKQKTGDTFIPAEGDALPDDPALYSKALRSVAWELAKEDSDG